MACLLCMESVLGLADNMCLTGSKYASCHAVCIVYMDLAASSDRLFLHATLYCKMLGFELVEKLANGVMCFNIRSILMIR